MCRKDDRLFITNAYKNAQEYATHAENMRHQGYPCVDDVVDREKNLLCKPF